MSNHRQRIERLDAAIPKRDPGAAYRAAFERALKLMTYNEVEVVHQVLGATEGVPEAERGERLEAAYAALPEELRKVYDRAMQRFEETLQAQDGENVEGVVNE